MTRPPGVVTDQRSPNCMTSAPFLYERVEHEREPPVSARGGASAERARPRRRGDIVLADGIAVRRCCRARLARARPFCLPRPLHAQGARERLSLTRRGAHKDLRPRYRRNDRQARDGGSDGEGGRAAVRTHAQRLASAEETAASFRELAAKQYVSELQVREQREQALDQKARLESLQRDRIALVRTLDELRRELAGHAPEAANRRAAIARDIEALEQQLTEYESRRRVVITAPTAGTVTAILAERGQTAVPTAPLLSILPEQAVLEAHLLVPSRAIGFIEPGQRVALRYEAFPYQRYGSARGRIKEIARTLITPGEVNLPVALREPVYRVTVSLDAQYIDAFRQRLALQSGMLLDADVWLERRRIIEWVFDPLYSVMGRV